MALLLPSVEAASDLTLHIMEASAIDGRQTDDASEAAIAKVFAKVRRKKIDFAHRLDAVARPGSRELRAVKIPASYDAW